MLPSGIESCNFLRRFLRRFCVDFASIFDFCVDFASIFDPKSWSQTKKLELVLFKLKFREPLYLLGFSEISFVFLLCGFSQKKTLPFGDVSFVTSHKKKTLPFGDVSFGCPDGLEPSTFRTTSRVSNIWNPLYLSAFPQFSFFFLRLFCGYLRKDRFCFNKSLKI